MIQSVTQYFNHSINPFEQTAKTFQIVTSHIPPTPHDSPKKQSDFEKFFNMIVANEGTGRRLEGLDEDTYSQFGLTKAFIEEYCPQKIALYSKIKAGTLKKDEAESIYEVFWPTLEAKTAGLPTDLKMQFADCAVSQGMRSAECFLSNAKDPGKRLRGETTYDAFVRMRIGGFMAQSWVPERYRKSEPSTNEAREAYLNRIDTVETHARGLSYPRTSFRILMLDCQPEDDLRNIASDWNVDLSYLKSINPSYITNGYAIVPTLAFKLSALSETEKNTLNAYPTQNLTTIVMETTGAEPTGQTLHYLKTANPEKAAAITLLSGTAITHLSLVPSTKKKRKVIRLQMPVSKSNTAALARASIGNTALAANLGGMGQVRLANIVDTAPPAKKASSCKPVTHAAPDAAPTTSSAAPRSQTITIKIQPKDTFYSIAARYNLTSGALKALNPQITDISKIKSGEDINVPK